MNTISFNLEKLDEKDKVLIGRVLGKQLNPGYIRRYAEEISRKHGVKYNGKYFANALGKSNAGITYAFQGHAPYILFLIHRELQRIQDSKNYRENN